MHTLRVTISPLYYHRRVNVQVVLVTYGNDALLFPVRRSRTRGLP